MRNFAFRMVSPFRIENVRAFQRHDAQPIREISKNKLRIVNPFKPWLLDTISKYQISGFLIIFDSVVCSPPEILPDRKFAEFSSEVASRIGRSGRARRTLTKALLLTPSELGDMSPQSWKRGQIPLKSNEIPLYET